MTDTSGMGSGSGPGTAQGDRARANASRQQGNGKLIPPPEPPATRWSPPKQPVGNPKGKRL